MAKCVHHWIYEAPNGTPILKGKCKMCGEKAEMPAALLDTTWREMDMERLSWMT